MVQNIFLGVLCVIALVSAIWANKGSFGRDDKKDVEGYEECSDDKKLE